MYRRPEPRIGELRTQGVDVRRVGGQQQHLCGAGFAQPLHQAGAKHDLTHTAGAAGLQALGCDVT